MSLFFHEHGQKEVGQTERKLKLNNSKKMPWLLLLHSRTDVRIIGTIKEKIKLNGTKTSALLVIHSRAALELPVLEEATRHATLTQLSVKC